MKIDLDTLILSRNISGIIGVVALIAIAINLFYLRIPDNLDTYGYTSIDEYLEYYQIPKDQIDEKSFKLLSDGFAMDNRSLFSVNEIIPDSKKENIDQFYALFKKQYIETILLDLSEIDLETFNVVVLGNGISKDKNHLYYKEKIIEMVDALTFKGFGSYGVDKDRGYLFINERIEIIPSTDYETFYASRDIVNYAKDKNHVYFLSKRLLNADSRTFEVIYDSVNLKEMDSYAKDKNHVYLNDRLIQDAEPKYFKLLEKTNYSIDKQNVYYRGKRMLIADYETFELISDKEGIIDARDSNNTYYQGVAY